MTLLTRSRSTGELVRATGSRCSPSASPSSISASGRAEVDPGSQSTNFSPISPCEPISHVASRFHGTKPVSSIRSVTAALLSCVTFRSEITPTGTPATFTSSPATSVDALSKIARTWYASCVSSSVASRTMPITTQGRSATIRPR